MLPFLLVVAAGITLGGIVTVARGYILWGGAQIVAGLLLFWVLLGPDAPHLPA